MRSIKEYREGKRGFTLVEMAIVLVIIGIILAGVMKGRDIVRGSQIKQFSQGFAQKWLTIASTYYDKKGQPLFDGPTNGSNATTTPPDGRMDGRMLAQPAGGEAGQFADDRDNVLTYLRLVGIEPCTMIKSDLEDASADCGAGGYNVFERMVDGEFTGKQRVGVGFYNYVISTGGPNRNVVLIQNVPVDVGIGLDTVIDGQADGQGGSCIVVNLSAANADYSTNAFTPAATGSTVTPLAWGTDSTMLAVIGLVLDY
ncbi:prepilin-type N-terminal cleavage/methylation domain-containing protein [Desulfobaculum xiamenense]|uniref:Prepilin-type N-terminal cleavage/methylation domain-containing protein n=1 Tax=Desulfobaculum xiamenense TaxID=995050 RepID=A0A846QHY9_9BACT|nr:prepilin-type N-terminal cleavage/methylation domain-containing protein [Desulfobaculum xiamenense]NJB67868.1 prepilin-type N-terminal cleavage/methylation domain-containing protein [Desulfobaculum xiamenense]